MDNLTAALEGLTARTIACRFTLENERMPMSRLSEKLKMAGGVVGRVHAKAEARADEVIAREPVINERIEDVFAGHFHHLEEADKALDALERDLALMGNEPLESSGGSREGDGEAKEPEPSIEPEKPPALPQAGRTGIAGMYRG